MYNYLLTGTKGMHRAIWLKFNRVDFIASYTEAKRPMHDWEAGLLQVSSKIKNPLSIVSKTIGDRLIKKYMIRLD